MPLFPCVYYTGLVRLYHTKIDPESYCLAQAALAFSNRMTASNQSDRRLAGRMSIERDVQYRVLGRRDGELSGAGKTLDISSSGVIFTTSHPLLPGRRVELAIDWPAQLDNKCALKLIARGRVVRFEGDRAAMEILQHEFRTRASRSLPTA